MPKQVMELLKKYREEIESVSDYHIKKVILFGSYARGDFKRDSDIDIMVLVDLDESHMKHYEDLIYDKTYDFNCKYDTDIMPVVQNINQYLTKERQEESHDFELLLCEFAQNYCMNVKVDWDVYYQNITMLK